MTATEDGHGVRWEIGPAAASADAAAPAGDYARTAGVEQMVRDHSVALTRTLAFVTLDRQVAADIAQETFFRLYRHWEDVAEHPDLRAWLYRVALNQAKDYRRALARAARLVARLGADAAVGDAGHGAQRWEPQSDLMDVLRTLPKRQRAVAALHYVGDLPLSEVARIMGISEGAVKSHLHRAHRALKDMLEEQ